MLIRLSWIWQRDYAARPKGGPGGVSGVAESDKGATGAVKDGKGWM